jgi:hypothetical protein
MKPKNCFLSFLAPDEIFMRKNDLGFLRKLFVVKTNSNVFPSKNCFLFNVLVHSIFKSEKLKNLKCRKSFLVLKAISRIKPQSSSTFDSFTNFGNSCVLIAMLSLSLKLREKIHFQVKISSLLKTRF